MFKTVGRHRKHARHMKVRQRSTQGLVMQAAILLVFLPYVVGGGHR